ncbi:MAG: hypothetical protein ACR2KT_15200 [Methylocella sp.]
MITGTSGLARERTAEEDLRYYLSALVSPGDVFSQGKLDGVDYRKLLRGAVAYDRHSLAGIFHYTANGRLTGEGAETNSILLHALLHHWGDARFAAVLRTESARVRKAVIAELDYGWGYPGWKSHEFPMTYRLAEHQKPVTSPP